MRRGIPLFPAFLVALALAAPAAAQVQTGSILVKAVDEQSAVLPGVAVTISSPVLVAGQTTNTTDAGGVCRFPSLPPGTYTVKMELQGFQTTVRQNIIVSVGQTTPIELALKVATVEETVTVTGESPVVDTTSANVNVTLNQQLLQSTPGGRDIWALLEYKVPGLVMTRPDVGGTQGGLQGTYSARGTTSAQNSQFLNGVNVGDPAAIGAAGYYYDYDAFEDIQVSVGAHDITVPTGGVFLNMATKTGGDRWSGRATVAWEGDATQTQNIDDELRYYGFRPNTNQVDFVSDVNVSGGGPLVKNKVRFFGSFRDWRVHVNVPVAYSQTVLDQTNITSGLGNLTWQINDKNRFTGFYSRQRYSKPNRLLTTAGVTTPESTVDEEDVFNVYQALWNSVLSGRFFVDARLSYNTILFPTYFNGADEVLTDTATGIIERNYTSEVIRHRNRLGVNATGQYYLDQALGGRHEFKFGFDLAHAITRNETHRWNDVALTYTSTTGAAQNVTLYGTPFKDASATDIWSIFGQDSYTVKRLTLIGGLRWERLEGYLPAQDSPPTKWATTGIGNFAQLPRTFDEVRDVVSWHTVGPRLSGIYDLQGNGRTALKASAARYYYVLSTGGGGVSAVNLNSNYSEQYNWVDLNGDKHFQVGEQTGTPVISAGCLPLPGVQCLTSIDPDFKRPYSDEFTAGIDRALIPDLKLSVAYTYRRERNLQVSMNPDNPYATTPSTAVDPGPDGVTGTPDDSTFQYYQRISAANYTVVTNDPKRVQTYSGLEITAIKRLSNRWQMLAGYTYSKAKVDHVSVDTSPNFLINANGNVFNDRPNQVKITGTYLLPFRDISVSGNFRSQSGVPIQRQISQRLAIGGSQTINLAPLGSDRTPTMNTLDLRVSKTFRSGRHEFDLSLDIYNVTNANTVWEVRTLTPAITVFQDGDINGTRNTIPQYMSPTQVLGPSILRFGAVWRF